MIYDKHSAAEVCPYLAVHASVSYSRVYREEMKIESFIAGLINLIF